MSRYRHHSTDLRILNKIIQDAGVTTYLIDKQKHPRAFKETTMRFVVDCNPHRLYKILDSQYIEYNESVKASGCPYAKVTGTRHKSEIYIDTLEAIDADSLREELFVALQENWAVPLLLALKDNKLLNILFPEIADCIALEGGQHHDETIFQHLIDSLVAAHKYKSLLKLAVLLHDIGKPSTYRVEKDQSGSLITTFYNHETVGATIAYNLCRRLKMSYEDTKYIVTMVRSHMFHFPEGTKDKAIRKWLYKVGPHWHDLFLLRIADRKGNKAKKDKPAITREMKQLEERIKVIIEKNNVVFREDLNIPPGITSKLINKRIDVDMVCSNLVGLVNSNISRNTKEWITEYVGKIYGIY